MKETKIIVNLGKNFIGHKLYIKVISKLNNVKINKLKVEKNRIIINIESSIESRDNFVKLIPGKFNFFEVRSINYLY